MFKRFTNTTAPIIATLACAVVLSAVSPASAVTVSQLGLQSVTIDSRQSGPTPSPTPIATVLPRIAEGAPGEISAGATAIRINPPAGGGWVFSVIAPTTASVISGDIVLGPVTVLPTQVEVVVVTPSTVASVIEFAQIRVLPTGCTALGAHNVRVSTDAGVAPDLNNATLATLTLVAGPSISSYGLASNSPRPAGTPVTVTLFAIDGCGNFIPNAVVPANITLDIDISGATLPVFGDGAPFVVTNDNVVPNQGTIAAGSVFNASGQGTFTVTNTNCTETSVLFVSDPSPIPDVITGLSWNNSIADAAVSTLAVQGVPPNPIADGVDPRTMQATLRDQCGNPIAGKLVSLSVQGVSAGGNAGAISITPTSATTNASGQATFQVRSSLAQTATFRATDKTNGVVVTQTGAVTFAANVTVAANSTVTASPAAIRADGIETSIITITLRNSLSNPVAGHPVALTAGPGSVIVAPAIAGVTTTDSNGRVSFTAKSTTPQATALTFSDTTVPAVALTPVAITFNNTVDIASGVVGVNRAGAATNVDFSYVVNSPVNVPAFNIRLGLDTNNDASSLEATLADIAGDVTPGSHAIATTDIRAALNALATPIKNGDRIVAVLDTGAAVTETAEGNNAGVSAAQVVNLTASSVVFTVDPVANTTSATVFIEVDSPANVQPYSVEIGLDRNGDRVIDDASTSLTTFVAGNPQLSPGSQSLTLANIRPILNAFAPKLKNGDDLIAVVDSTGAVIESDEALTNNVASRDQVVDLRPTNLTITPQPNAVFSYVVDSAANVEAYDIEIFYTAVVFPANLRVTVAGDVTPGPHFINQSLLPPATIAPPASGQAVFAVLDRADTVDEFDDTVAANQATTNNTAVDNLVVTSVVVNSDPVLNTTRALVSYVINYPVALATFNLRVGLDRAPADNLIDGPGSELASITVNVTVLDTNGNPANAPGAHTIETADFRTAFNAQAPRIKSADRVLATADLSIAGVDEGNAPAEGSEVDDNRASQVQSVDLVGNSITVSVDLAANKTTAVASYTIASPAAVPPFAFRLGIDRTNDLLTDAGGDLGAAFTPAGGLDDDLVDYTFPGAHRVTLNEFRTELNAQASRIQNGNRIIANIDTANVVGEDNELPASNVVSQAQVVDLRIDSVTLNTAGGKYTGRVDYTIISPGNVTDFLVRMGVNTSALGDALIPDVAGVVVPGTGSTGEIDLNPGLLAKAIAMNSSPTIVGSVDVTGVVVESVLANNEANASAKYDVDVKLDALGDFGTSAGIPFAATFTYNVIGHQPSENFQVSLFVSPNGNASISPGDKLLQLGATTDPATFVFTTAADKSVGAHTHTRIVKIAAGDAAGGTFFIKAQLETVLPAPAVLANHVTFPDDNPATNNFARQNNPLGSLDVDLDSDGLTLRQEQIDGFARNGFVLPATGPVAFNSFGTSIDTNQDTDGDKILDPVEVSLADPALATFPDDDDTDDDGLKDGEEDANQNGRIDACETNPRNWDTDGDGLSDLEEKNGFLITRYFGNGARFDALPTDAPHEESVPCGAVRPAATGVRNADGTLRNVQMVRVFSDPLKADTDGDGISDYNEVNTFALSAAADGSIEAIGLGAIKARAGLLFNPPGHRNAAGVLDSKAVKAIRTDPADDDSDGDGLADTVDPAPQINPIRVGFAANTDQARLLNFDQDATGGADGFLEAPDANGDGIPDFSRYTEATLEQLFAIDFSNTGSLLDGFDVGGLGRGGVDPAIPGGAGCDPFPSRFGSYRIRGNGQVGGDGVLDRSDSEGGLIPTDNCPQANNVNQDDFDGDGLGDSCDADLDNDGVPNTIDFFNQSPIRICTPPGAANPACGVGLASSTGLALFGLAGLSVGSRRRRRSR